MNRNKDQKNIKTETENKNEAQQELNEGALKEVNGGQILRVERPKKIPGEPIKKAGVPIEKIK